MRRPLPPPEPGGSVVNPLPPAVLALFLVIGAAEAVLSLADAGLVGGAGSVGWRVRAIEAAAVSPVVQDLVLTGRAPALLSRYVLYGFVHGGAVHALFAGALLLALGKFVAEAMPGWRVMAVFFGALAAGGLLFGALAGEARPLFGAYPGVYGLIGAFTYLLWTRIGASGGNRLGAFQLIGGLLAIQLLFGLLFGADPSWIGDVGGFGGGLVLAPLLAPGGLRALRDRLRR